MTKYKKWAKHIINRFGKTNALRYALTGANCPCYFLEKECWLCKHCDIIIDELDWWCNKAREFYQEFTIYQILILKKKIRRLLE